MRELLKNVDDDDMDDTDNRLNMSDLDQNVTICHRGGGEEGNKMYLYGFICILVTKDIFVTKTSWDLIKYVFVTNMSWQGPNTSLPNMYL